MIVAAAVFIGLLGASPASASPRSQRLSGAALSQPAITLSRSAPALVSSPLGSDASAPAAPGRRRHRSRAARRLLASASSPRALILGSTVTPGSATDGSGVSLEQQGAEADGFSVTVASDSEWETMTAAQFRAYQVLIIGDPTCSETVGAGTQALQSAATWEPVVMSSGGNKVLIGTDPTYHNDGPSGVQRGDLLEANGIAYAGAVSGATGIYLDLSCSYDSSPGATPVPILDGLSTFGSGQFTVTGEGSIGACATAVNIVASTGPTTGLTDSNLSNWNCSVHEAFDKFGADYTPLALAPNGSGFPSDFCANDVDTKALACGSPYILVSGVGVSSAGPSGSEQGGSPNGSEHQTTCSSSHPVNCATGAFWHEFSDASVPGRGLPLNFSRTYNSMNAEHDGPLGFGWTGSYAMSLNINTGTGVVTVQEEGGAQTTFVSNGSGGYLAPPRVLATLTLNGDGTYTFTRNSDHTQYVFSAAGKLEREIDRNGNATTLSYAGGMLEKVTGASGRSLTLSYTGSRIHTITDPMGRTTTFSYDGAGDLVGTTDGLGRAWSFTYDGSHRMLSMTDPRGGMTTNTYDSAGRVTAQSDPMGRTTTWAYSGDPASNEGAMNTQTDPRGAVTAYQYKNLELVAETSGAGGPEEATTKYEYDPKTLGVTAMTNPDGQTTTNTYDARGNLVTSTDPLGRKTTYSYNGFDETTSVQDPRGTTTSYRYDSNGNLLEKAVPLIETGEVAKTTYAYKGEPGEVTAVTDPVGHTTVYSYNGDGDRTSATNADANKTTYSYNGDGAVTSEMAPSGRKTSYAYNEGGEIVGETDPLGHLTSYMYDGDGNRTTLTDVNGHVTAQTYNADNELVELKRADGSTRKTEWDAAGNEIAQIDGAGHATRYTYDALNRPIIVTDPDGHITRYEYDAAGRKTAVVNAEGQTASYGYDAAGEPTSSSYSGGSTPAVTEAYDADGNRTELKDGSGTSVYSYDSLNRLISSTDGSGATVKYGYDLAGHVLNLTYPNGKTVTHAYDGAGNLTSVTDWLGHKTSFGYNANANLTSEEYAGGVSSQLTYDEGGRVAGITVRNAGGPVASFAYSRDPLGQVASETGANAEPVSQKYGYDAVNQLTAAGAAPYGYDAANNPTTLGTGVSQSFDPANELTAATRPGQGTEPRGGEPPGAGGGGGGSTSTSGGKQGGGGGGGVESFQAHTPVLPVLDAMVRRAGTGASKLKSPRLQTHGTHDLLLAFIAASSSGQRVVGVSGGGLRWSLVSRSDGASGAAEVWQAHTRSKLNAAVTVRLRRGTRATATIAAFSGAEPHLVAHAASHGHATVPTSTYVAASGVTVWAVGQSAGQTTPVRPTAGQQLVTQQFNKGARADGWVQLITTPHSGAQIADAATAAQWGLVTVAIGVRSASVARVSRQSSGHASSPPAAVTGVVSGAASAATSASTPSVAYSFTYDARGDRVSESASGSPTVALSYDEEGRLIGVGTEISYAYNGDGVRVSQTVHGEGTHFVWGGSQEAPELLQGGSTSYIYGPGGLPIEQISGETATFPHQDQQGSTRLLTDASGNVTGRYEYDPWGRATSHTGATTAMQYRGQYTDAATGFQYLRARYYDPATGQFLTRDPAEQTTLAPYGYAANNPTNHADPTGLWASGLCVGGDGTGGPGINVTASGEICYWEGGNGLWASWHATTFTVTGGVGVGASAGFAGNLGVQVDFGAKSPEDLSGPQCDASASGVLGVGITASVGCTLDSLGIFGNIGPEGDASAGVDVGATDVLWASNGYHGWGFSAPPPGQPLCNDQAYQPFGNVA